MKIIETYEEPSWIKQYWLFLVYVMVLIGIAIFENYKTNGAVDTDISTSYQGIVTSIYKHKSILFITTDQKEKLGISPSYNYSLSPYDILNFIQAGDNISKRSCSDTIYVMRNEKTYDFIMFDYSYNNPSIDHKKHVKLLMERILRHEENGCEMEGVNKDINR